MISILCQQVVGTYVSNIVRAYHRAAAKFALDSHIKLERTRCAESRSKHVLPGRIASFCQRIPDEASIGLRPRGNRRCLVLLLQGRNVREHIASRIATDLGSDVLAVNAGDDRPIRQRQLAGWAKGSSAEE